MAYRIRISRKSVNRLNVQLLVIGHQRVPRENPLLSELIDHSRKIDRLLCRSKKKVMTALHHARVMKRRLLDNGYINGDEAGALTEHSRKCKCPPCIRRRIEKEKRRQICLGYERSAISQKSVIH